jgi:hypothetical protein
MDKPPEANPISNMPRAYETVTITKVTIGMRSGFRLMATTNGWYGEVASRPAALLFARDHDWRVTTTREEAMAS